MRLSRVFSSEDGDDSDADDEFDLGSPWKAAATTQSEGTALEDADMDVECVADVFVRLSSAFSSCDEDDCDAEEGKCHAGEGHSDRAAAFAPEAHHRLCSP